MVAVASQRGRRRVPIPRRHEHRQTTFLSLGLDSPRKAPPTWQARLAQCNRRCGANLPQSLRTSQHGFNVKIGLHFGLSMVSTWYQHGVNSQLGLNMVSTWSQFGRNIKTNFPNIQHQLWEVLKHRKKGSQQVWLVETQWLNNGAFSLRKTMFFSAPRQHAQLARVVLSSTRRP